ncbi:n-acetylglucosamine-6-phosphate deacetylase [Thamnocephalis sphaerospora]|uniref:N-acetylglucosamine-6-phosphate deacetylase n=1 Tax=Thamnocephalis sphaerospora TaxID=78915 RepID=A0A4P9XIB7_9FUNG|nr:n-acetylglucosamine-6-phosphate deacetylase [Thamnocephalis sphaerospora]|eukprot:RKP05425.1 n-acetylglucosamine-6-phosphate deacetylase [Thamnocephalis sphaerospora]
MATANASRPRTVQIYNCRLLRDGQIHDDDYLWMRDGKLLDPKICFWSEQIEADERINAHGLLVTPGLIDVQINGAFGVDFSTDFEAMQAGGVVRAAQGLLRQGCTSFCPTLVSSAPDVYTQALPLLGPRKGNLENGAEVLGAHLEGPFIAHEKKGAHDPRVLQASVSGIADIEKIYGPIVRGGNASIITVAPEIPGMYKCIEELDKRGIVVSMGHSMAQIAEAEEGLKHGAKFVTHMFNAMSSFHHRDPAIVGLLGATHMERPYYGLIADGFHAHPCSVRIAYSAHPKGLVLVTDSMAALGLPLGEYTLGDMHVECTKDAVYIAGTNTLAGSRITLAECIRRFRKFTSCSVEEAIDSATLHPATLLGVQDRKGTLKHGADADLCFFDDQLHIQRVFIDGQEVDGVES